ncbi:MAG: response regulator [Rhodospirillales bacterium]|nr:response regulator [Rhodospirillales bacterium]
MKNYNLTKLNILVVERHKLMRRLMRDVIRALGVDHVRVVNEQQLLNNEDADFKPDLIFTDWSPEVNGIELLRSIRDDKSEIDRFIPIVVVTAFTELSQVCEARDAGVTEFLAKPVSSDMIYRRICALVERPRDFITTKDFFGPDRRRRAMEFQGDDRRVGGMPIKIDPARSGIRQVA